MKCFKCGIRIKRIESPCGKYAYIALDGKTAVCADQNIHAPSESEREAVLDSFSDDVPLTNAELDMLASNLDLNELNRVVTDRALIEACELLDEFEAALTVYLDYTGLYPSQVQHLEDCDECEFDTGTHRFTLACETLPMQDKFSYKVKSTSEHSQK